MADVKPDKEFTVKKNYPKKRVEMMVRQQYKAESESSGPQINMKDFVQPADPNDPCNLQLGKCYKLTNSSVEDIVSSEDKICNRCPNKEEIDVQEITVTQLY